MSDELPLSLGLASKATIHQTLFEARDRLGEEALGRSRGSMKAEVILLGIVRDSFVRTMESFGVRR